MKRRSVKVIKSRLEDIEVGDVVNRSPDAELGWFVVDAISTLFNGNIQLADVTEQLTVSGDHKDMVGLQLVEEIVLDERGMIAPAAPVAAAAPPMAAAPPVAAAVPAPPADAPSPAAPAPTAPSPTAAAAADAPLDLATEAAVAAEVAVSAPANASKVPDVDLGLVLSLLGELDVGDAPEISTEYEPGRPLPANAVAVDGGALPEKPSYKTPVVIPEGGMLPRRGRAA